MGDDRESGRSDGRRGGLDPIPTLTIGLPIFRAVARRVTQLDGLMKVRQDTARPLRAQRAGLVTRSLAQNPPGEPGQQPVVRREAVSAVHGDELQHRAIVPSLYMGLVLFAGGVAMSRSPVSQSATE